jgi:hypothetical protein
VAAPLPAPVAAPVPAPVAAPVPAPVTCAALRCQQCGGIAFNGCTHCVADSGCQFKGEWYSQCVPCSSQPTAVGCQ